jgi:transcriptional regulator with XRE-family HTH domain
MQYVVKPRWSDFKEREVITVLTMPRRSKLKLPPLRLTTDETMGQRLARLRKERSLTQVELAEKMGIIQGLVTNYERDRLRMHAEMVTRFAVALGVSADELLGLKSTRSAAVVQSSSGLSLKIVRRLAKIEQLPPSQQKALLQTLDLFLQGAAQHKQQSAAAS